MASHPLFCLLLTYRSWEIIHLQRGQLEQVGWPRLLYGIPNFLGKALPATGLSFSDMHVE